MPPLDKWPSFQLCSNETQCFIQIKLESLPETRTIFLGFSKLGVVFQRPEAYLIVTAGEMTAAQAGMLPDTLWAASLQQ